MNSIQLIVVVLVSVLVRIYQSNLAPVNHEYHEYQPVCINEDGSISDEFVTIKTLPYYNLLRSMYSHMDGPFRELEDNDSYRGIIWPYGSISRGVNFVNRRDNRVRIYEDPDIVKIPLNSTVQQIVDCSERVVFKRANDKVTVLYLNHRNKMESGGKSSKFLLVNEISPDIYNDCANMNFTPGECIVVFNKQGVYIRGFRDEKFRGYLYENGIGQPTK